MFLDTDTLERQLSEEEKQIPDDIIEFTITSRTPEIMSVALGFPSLLSLRQDLRGKHVLFCGATWNLQAEKYFLGRGASHVTAIDGSLLCGPSWTMANEDRDRGRAKIVRRSSFSEQKLREYYMAQEEFLEIQLERRRFKHPHLTHVGAFLTNEICIPEELPAPQRIIDLYGPIGYAKGLVQKIGLIASGWRQLASGGRMYVMPMHYVDRMMGELLLSYPELNDGYEAGDFRTNMPGIANIENPEDYPNVLVFEKI